MKLKLLPLFTLLALSSLVMLQSCVVPDDDGPPQCDDSTEHYNLSADQKKILPYTGYDTISMVSNTGDTICCIGTGKQYFTTREFQAYGNPACAGHGTEKFYEAYKIQFVDSVKGQQIELSYYSNVTNGLYKGLSAVYVTLRGGGGGTRDNHISSPTAYNFLGNIEIQGVMYYNLTKAQSEPVDTAEFVLINKTNGILKIQLKATDSWELIRK